MHQRKNLVPIAISKEFWACFIVPKEIKDKERAFKILKKIFPEIDSQILKKKIYKKNDPYELIKRKISEKAQQEIRNLNFKGIYLTKKIERFYPFRNLFSHFLGFVLRDEKENFKGQYGLEAFYDKELNQGASLVLTLEKEVQEKSYQILKELKESQKAAGGSIVVSEPSSGRILAMVSLPDYDPNFYFKSPLKVFLNPFLELVYEPGSIMKVITIASALDAKKISLKDKYFDEGKIKIGSKIIKNWDHKSHGRIGIKEVLSHSINTGAVWAVQKLGKSLFLKYLEKFGFGKKTNFDLPGEVSGSLKEIKKGRDLELATASFGQGISVTLAQLIQAFSAFANEGKMKKPYLVEKIIFPNGIIKKFNSQEAGRPISKETAELMNKLLVNAVEVNILGRVKGYQLAGKTGTAQIPFKGKYLDAYIHSYIGWGPLPCPKFLILIKLEKPQEAMLSGYTVVPAFRELAEFLLKYYNLAPNFSKSK